MYFPTPNTPRPANNAAQQHAGLQQVQQSGAYRTQGPNNFGFQQQPQRNQQTIQGFQQARQSNQMNQAMGLGQQSMGAGPAMAQQQMQSQQGNPMQAAQQQAMAQRQQPGIGQALNVMGNIYGQQRPQQMPSMQQSAAAARAQMPQQMPSMQQSAAAARAQMPQQMPQQQATRVRIPRQNPMPF